MFTSLELFSGAGGLARGLEESGFIHKAFVEYNKDACLSLRANYDPAIVHHVDVREFSYGNFSEIDIIAGGPPCQPFSLGGKHQGDNDHRDMFPYAIEAIEQLSPKAFIFENVKGLLRQSFSEYFEYIIRRLKQPSSASATSDTWKAHLAQLRTKQSNKNHNFEYDVVFQLINAADYGVPQRRERVVIVGIKRTLNLKWEYPKPTHSKERLLWDMYVTEEYWDRHNVRKAKREAPDLALQRTIEILKDKWGMLSPPSMPWVTVRDVLADLPNPNSQHKFTDHLFRDGAKSYPGHTGSDYDWPSKTIKAGGHGVPGGENMVRFPDGKVRYFTVLEAKRIQTFPDNYRIIGSWGEAMRQIGNAVPVKLANVIGNELHRVLSKTT